VRKACPTDFNVAIIDGGLRDSAAATLCYCEYRPSGAPSLIFMLRSRPDVTAILHGTRAMACALLLLGMAWPTSAEDAKRPTAILIIARPDLPDSFFVDSVLLVMNNLAPAPIGIIINRPTHVAVAELFPGLERLAPLHDKVYYGGPVAFGSVWFLFRAATPPEHAIQAFDGVCVSANRELLLRLLSRDKPMDGLRIFIGHAGWAPGQLEAEIDRGDWTLARANVDAIFNGKSEHPWPESRLPQHST
jgi:putative transcriptional regulator